MIQISSQIIDKKDNQIRKFFSEVESPFYFISYASFNKNFQADAQKNFKQQNLNIIDMHLKYRQYIRQQMAPYKWLPILGMSSYYLLRLKMKSTVLIAPLIYVMMFDYYFQPFFCWLHKDDKIINMRNQFVTKLSKLKNKNRRIKLWKQLQKQFKRQDQINSKSQQKDQLTLNSQKKPFIPYKYLKFGSLTQYVFHSKINNVQMSSIFQTQLFQTYMGMKNLNLSTLKIVYNKLNYLFSKFKEYKKDKNKNQSYINVEKLLRFKDIKDWEKYNISMNIQNRIRRFMQILAFSKNGTLYFSGFTLDKIFYLYKHQDIVQPAKYNIQNNIPDLTLYYTAILIPFFLQKIIKR